MREDFKYPEDFNGTAFTELMKKMNITITDQREDLLQNLGLGENGKKFNLNNAGVMFFGKKRDYYIRQVYVTCVLFKGTNKVKIIDRKDFREGLLQDYENAYKFLQQHLRLEYIIEGGGPRKEIPEIPYEALKEALLNAIIHRDYFEIGARVMVEIFDDRVEISNPGELLVDKEKLGKKSVSVARNPILFDIFHRLQLIEKVGTGIQRIVDVTKTRNIKVEFDIDSFFNITFYRAGIAKGQGEKYEQIAIDKYPSITLQSLNKLGWTWDKFNYFVPSLSQDCPKSVPCEIFAMILILSQKEINIVDLMKVLNKTNRTRFRKHFLNPLIETGFIKFTIPGKPKSPLQQYIITEKGKNLLEK